MEYNIAKNEFINKTILITGGSGSIGSEICMQIATLTPKKIVVFDICENTIFNTLQKFREQYPLQNFDVVVGSIRDVDKINETFEKYKPDIVFHAAAHKHILLMEQNPSEAIKNNIIGTYNVALAAKKQNTEKFVLISTDKAVNPTSVMGASKKMCEMIIQAFAKESETVFSAVRLGNVLGSSGSVLPIFIKQIKSGGPVTVTHPDVKRYFMSISEAAQLIIQASIYANGGEIFILDMGEPIKIYDLAKYAIKKYGNNKDIEIKFTGLKPGEKLDENLFTKEDNVTMTMHNKIFVTTPIPVDVNTIEEKLNVIKKALGKSNMDMKNIMKQEIPTYCPQ